MDWLGSAKDRRTASIDLRCSASAAHHLARTACAVLLLQRSDVSRGSHSDRETSWILLVWNSRLHFRASAAELRAVAWAEWNRSRPLRQNQAGTVRRVCTVSILVR